LFMPLADLMVLFSRLNKAQDDLTPPERALLQRIASELYNHVSIDQIEKLSGQSEER